MMIQIPSFLQRLPSDSPIYIVIQPESALSLEKPANQFTNSLRHCRQTKFDQINNFLKVGSKKICFVDVHFTLYIRR